MDFRFYREDDNRWYIDLPDYIGDKADLEMVMGADSLLTIMSQNKKELHLTLTEDENVNEDCCLTLCPKQDTVPREQGRFYLARLYDAIEFEIWLCAVTLFVFNGRYPEIINIMHKK